MKIEITVNAPALDRLCDILQGLNVEGLQTLVSKPAKETKAPVAPAPAPVKEQPLELVDDAPEVVTTPPVKTEPAKKVAKPTPPPATKEEVATVEEITVLAQELIKGSDIPTLRAVLDEAGIKGEKISTCDKKFYPAIKLAIQEKLASL